MNKIISLGLLVCGVVLIAYGLNAADSISSSFSRFFTGSPTDETIWMIIGGTITAAIGLTGVLRGSSKQS